ncbi:UNVERIFIED_CONTAM: Transposon Ty3-G Gag-Pol polyprotein [Sesamum radiatum]|uniref:Transposon Ty3-G Gag-Pol polyprotein n=1 Tax=Sesamum radiatum TaxID=300843 RepID=A0AAW2W3Q5_SESRA
MRWCRGPTIGRRCGMMWRHTSHLFDLSAGQGRPSEEGWFATTLAIPMRPWRVSLWTYISGLPKVGDLGSIIVVVDRLSKYATFIAARNRYAEGTAHLFFKHIIKYWGLPRIIVSDRILVSPGLLDRALQNPRIQLSMSSSYHSTV